MNNTHNNSQMEYSRLPPHIVIGICKYLDDDSLLSALIAFDTWCDSVATSTKIINKFQLVLNENFFQKWSIQDLPKIPIKNVDISSEDRDSFDSSALTQVLNKYKTSIANIVFRELIMDIHTFGMMLDAVENLTCLELDCMTVVSQKKFRFKLPKLKELTILTPCTRRPDINGAYDRMQRLMRLFKYNTSIEKIHIESYCCCLKALSFVDINEFVATIPNLKHLILRDKEDHYPPMNAKFPARLETFETNLLTSYDPNQMSFLKKQKDTLLNLVVDEKFESLEDDFMEIVFEMKLRNFRCLDRVLIANYERTPQSYRIM